MPRASVLAAVVMAIGAAALFAAEFWQTKPYTDWNDKEVARILNDSPWARTVPLDMSALRTAGVGGGGGMGRGGMQKSAVVIRWVSARPIMQALIRNKYADNAGGEEAKSRLAQPQTQYIVTVSGFPAQLVRSDPDGAREQLRAATALLAKDKDPQAPESVELLPQNGQINVVFRFSKAKPITADDKEVTFSTKLGVLVVRQKFSLAAMEFNGKLEL